MIPTVQIIHGDVMEALPALPALPDKFIQTCVTSPPYWGLRDYGTGTWLGGDPDCGHVIGEMRRGINLAQSAASTRGGAVKAAAVEDIKARAECPHCGAVREDQQIGLEATPEEYIEKMVLVFREVRRLLRDDGTIWLNLGDCYAGGGNGGGGSFAKDGMRAARPGTNKNVAGRKGNRGIAGMLKAKDMVGMPWRVALALQADGWYLRSDIIWHKPNPMPESASDRPTKAHEYIFLLSKRADYYYDAAAIKEPVTGGAHSRLSKEAEEEIMANRANGASPIESNPNGHGVNPKARGEKQFQVAATSSMKLSNSLMVSMSNKRTVWTVATAPYSGAHFATFPPKLITPCILAGTSERGCCAKCRAPYKRVTESESESGRDKTETKYDEKSSAGRLAQLRQNARKNGEEYNNRKKTVDWVATCGCKNQEIIPCTVLDPFGGSGTTGRVALERGRNAILIELNREYCRLGAARTNVTASFL